MTQNTIIQILNFNPINKHCSLKIDKHKLNSLEEVHSNIKHFAAPLHCLSIDTMGCFSDKIQDSTGLSPRLLKLESLQTNLIMIWQEKLKKENNFFKSGAFMHNLKLSFSSEYECLILDAQRSIEDFLVKVSKRIISKWESFFLNNYNTEAIARNGKILNSQEANFSYIIAIHKYDNSMHAHISIYPYTNAGKYINLADNPRKNTYIYKNLRELWSMEAMREIFKEELHDTTLATEDNPLKKWIANLIKLQIYKDTLCDERIETEDISKNVFIKFDSLSKIKKSNYINLLKASFAHIDNIYLIYKDYYNIDELIDSLIINIRQKKEDIFKYLQELNIENNKLESLNNLNAYITQLLTKVDYDIENIKDIKAIDKWDLIYAKLITPKSQENKKMINAIKKNLACLIPDSEKTSFGQIYKTLGEMLSSSTPEEQDKLKRLFKLRNKMQNRKERLDALNILKSKLKAIEDSLDVPINKSIHTCTTLLMEIVRINCESVSIEIELMLIRYIKIGKKHFLQSQEIRSALIKLAETG